MRWNVAVHADAARTFAKLPEEVKRSVLKWADALSSDLHAGQQVQAAKIPKALERKFELGGLWRLRLTEGWRALYTTATRDGQTARIFIIWIGTHKQYDRLMGYRS